MWIAKNLPKYRFYILLILLSGFPFSTKCQTGSRVLEYSTNIRVINGSLEKTNYVLIEVDDKKSDWMSDIKIPFKKKNKLNILEACVIKPGGEIVRRLDKKDIITKNDISDGSFYDDHLIKEFRLRGNEYPYIIKYSYRLSYDDFIDICDWRPNLFSDVSIDKASLTVDLPLDYKVKINTSGIFDFKVDSMKSGNLFSWISKNIVPLKKEIFMTQDQVPFVRISPDKFKYSIPGSLRSWESFGEWVDRLNQGLTDLPLSEQFIVDTMIKDIKDKRQIIRKLYHYIQDHTRYISVNIDIGGMKSYPASYVCINKYGDCKGLSTYMMALLEHIGIPSYRIIIDADRNPQHFYTEFPSQQFNHVILCVPLEKDTVWLENTSNYVPFNYLGTFTQDRYGLLINGTNSRLVKTPALKPDDLLQSAYYFFQLNPDGNGYATLSKEVKGDQFEEYVTGKQELTESEMKELIEKELIPKNSELTKWELQRDDRDSPSMKINLEMTVSNQLRRIGNSLVLNPFHLQFDNLEKPETREMPVRIYYLINQRDSIVYDLKLLDRYDVQIPEDIDIQSIYGYYKVKFYKNDQAVIIARKFQLYSNEYPLDKYSDFYSFIDNIVKSQKKSGIVLNKI
jgi:hypothetical protein